MNRPRPSIDNPRPRARRNPTGAGRATRGVVIGVIVFALFAVAPVAAQQATSSGASSARGPGAVLRHVDIKWAKVAGAIGYRVLVRPLGGDVTIDERSKSTSIPVMLPPGTYQVRVISFNIFDKPASISPWHNIDVIHVHRPVVKLLSPKILYAGLKGVRETVDGLHFLPETTVALTHGGRVVAKGAIDRVRDDQLRMRFDLMKTPPGTYDLQVSNPEHLVLVMHDAIQVRPRVRPRVDSLSVHSGYNDRAYRDVTVTGGGFLSGTSFFLVQGSNRIDIPDVTIHAAGRASVDLNLGSATPGNYDLVAVNPGGKVARLRTAFKVLNITTPIFESVKPSVFTIGESTGVFELRAKEMIPGAHVFLRKAGQLIPTVPLGSLKKLTSQGGRGAHGAGAGAPSVKGTTEIGRFQIVLPTTPASRYDLVIANSELLRTVAHGAVTVKPKPIPRLTGASISHAYDTKNYKGVVLEGVNLKPSFGVVLKRGNTALSLASRFISASRMSVNIDFRNKSPGTYSILVEQSGEVVASLPGGIVVTTPYQKYIHPSGLSVMIGYPYSLVLSESFANAVSISTIGGQIVADFPLGVRFFPTVPGVRDMGLGVRLGYSLYDQAASGATTTTTSTLGMFLPGIDLYYRTPFNFWLNGIVSAGYGMSLSSFHSTSSSSTVSGSSLDFYYRLGVGGEVDLGKSLIFRVGVSWMRVLYAETNLDTLDLTLNGGVRFGG